ncbi:MAG: amidohydrolase [candidate division WOR-3 bacterium]|nr:amidohydrolase [candidate division WOR-3 bacterium]
MENKFIINAKKIYALDDANTIYQSMLIENGKIKKLFNSPLPYGAEKTGYDTKSTFYDIQKISFPDNFIVPGFIDSHTHILGVGLQVIFPEVSQVQSLDEIYDRIASAYLIAKEFRFLVVFNFDPENIKERRYPHRKELDRVLKDYPLLLYRIDGHSGVLNSKGLEEILATKDSALNDGLELDPYKEPTGVIRGKAYEFTARYFTQKINPDIRLEAFYKACDLAIKNGVTTMVTMLGSETDNITCELLIQYQSRLPIEVIPFYQTKDIKRVKRLGISRIGGCILIDGSFGSHTAGLRQDYADSPNNQGILYMTDEELEEFYRNAENNNLQTAVHAIGDKAIEQVVRVWEKILKENKYRHRIEHCELLDDELIERIRKLGLIVSVQPAFEYYWGGPDKMYAQRLGDRWQKTNPLKKLFDAGIIVAGGSDAPITPIDPLLGMKSGVEHPNPEFRISPLQALQMFTKNGAYAVFNEDRIGMLKENYQADFVVIKNDPMKTTDNQILKVFKSGRELK